MAEGKNYEWNTPYKDLSETLQIILDTTDKLFSVKENKEKWDYGEHITRLEMIDMFFKPLNLKGKLTEKELEYLTDINAHTLRAYLEN